MRITDNKIPQYLNAALIAIESSMADDAIGKEVEKVGYSKEEFQEGLRLYNNAVEAVSREIVISEKAQHLEANVLAAKKDAYDAYQTFRKMAKASFGKNVLGSLGLNGVKPRSTGDCLAVACGIFDNALKISEIRSKLTIAGYSETVLQSERVKIANYDMATQTLLALKKSLKLAMKDRNNALRQLKTWVDLYLEKAQEVFSEKKDLLEKLGITK